MGGAAEPEPGLLEAAARALAGELAETSRFRFVGGHRFVAAPALDGEPERLAQALGALGARLIGAYTVPYAAEGVVLRPGLLDDGGTVVSAVAPPDRPAYAEALTWFEDGRGLLTSGRGTPLPALPRVLAGVALPGATPERILAVHLREVTIRRVAGAAPAHHLGRGGPLIALARYLTALGF